MGPGEDWAEDVRYLPEDDDPPGEDDYLSDDECYEEDWPEDDDFADPTGHSALRASSPTNPRNLPCPRCGEPNRLTLRDKELGYICDPCADRAERGQFYPDGY